MTTRDASVSVIPVSGARAEGLVATLHDAEEDDERIRAAIDDRACATYAALVGDRPVGAAVVRVESPRSPARSCTWL